MAEALLLRCAHEAHDGRVTVLPSVDAGRGRATAVDRAAQSCGVSAGQYLSRASHMRMRARTGPSKIKRAATAPGARALPCWPPIDVAGAVETLRPVCCSRVLQDEKVRF